MTDYERGYHGHSGQPAALPWHDDGRSRNEHSSRRKEERIQKIKQSRRSRWEDTAMPIPGAGLVKHMPTSLPSLLEMEAFLVRYRLEELNWKLTPSQIPLEIAASRERSLSPEPVYDGQGKRLNTREQRVKDKLNKERSYLVQQALALNPNFKPPADFKAFIQKKSRKLYIPVKEYPDYNFIGLIIGPRGNTQKRFEKETGTKIAIRGRGSVKEGKGRKDGKAVQSEDDELHVLIMGDTDEALDRACKLVEPLLVPVDESANAHKQAQLIELAKYNGTFQDKASFFERSFTPADVTCAICGEKSHPEKDCPLRGSGAPPPKKKPGSEQPKVVLDSEYNQFLSEIGEGKPNLDQKYEEFLSAVGSGGSDGNVQSSMAPWAGWMPQHGAVGGMPMPYGYPGMYPMPPPGYAPPGWVPPSQPQPSQ